MKSYSVLLFDVDDTILDFEACERAAFRDMCRDLNIPFSEELYATYHRTNIHYWKLHEQGLSEKDYFQHARFSDSFKACSIQADGMQADLCFRDHLDRYAFCIPGAEDLIRTLASEASVYFITNGDTRAQNSRLALTPFLPLVKGRFISDEIGFPKPSKEFFDCVFRTVPYGDDVLIIGDSLTSDIRGGETAGVDTVWFCRNDQPYDHPEVRPTYKVTKLEDILKIVHGEGEAFLFSE